MTDDVEDFPFDPTAPVRRRKPPTRPLTQHVPIRFDAATIEQVRQFSDDDGLTVSSWIRHVVRREVERRSAAGACLPTLTVTTTETVASGAGTFRRTS